MKTWHGSGGTFLIMSLLKACLDVRTFLPFLEIEKRCEKHHILEKEKRNHLEKIESPFAIKPTFKLALGFTRNSKKLNKSNIGVDLL